MEIATQGGPVGSWCALCAEREPGGCDPVCIECRRLYPEFVRAMDGYSPRTRPRTLLRRLRRIVPMIAGWWVFFVFGLAAGLAALGLASAAF